MSRDAEALRALLEPHRGRWVAVDVGWTRVLASAQERAECSRLARMLGLEGVVVLYRVPDAPLDALAGSAP